MFDKFKAFFNGEIDLSQLQKVVDLKDVVLNVFSMGDNGSFVKVERNTTQVDKSIHVALHVDSAQIANPELLASQLGKLLEAHRENDNQPTFEVEANKTVQHLGEGNPYQENITYFESKVPEGDVKILRAAYYIKWRSELGEKVDNLVKNVRQVYGTKGSSIVNLVGRDYFETHMKPMYEMLSERPNFEPRMFTENYELIVRNAPFAYFVNSAQTEEDLVGGLVDKITFSRRYGQHKLAIHAIGSENIAKVQAAVLTADVSDLIQTDIDSDVQRQVMTMTVYYK